MTVRRIDPDVLRRLWADGVATADIAEHFGVQYPAVNKAAKAMGLERRPPGGVQRRQPPPPPPPKPLSGYAIAAEIAARDGITLTQALQRWHRTRRTA